MQRKKGEAYNYKRISIQNTHTHTTIANKMRPSATDNNDFVHNLKDNSSYFDYFSPLCTSHTHTNSFITNSQDTSWNLSNNNNYKMASQLQSWLSYTGLL